MCVRDCTLAEQSGTPNPNAQRNGPASPPPPGGTGHVRPTIHAERVSRDQSRLACARERWWLFSCDRGGGHQAASGSVEQKPLRPNCLATAASNTAPGHGTVTAASRRQRYRRNFSRARDPSRGTLVLRPWRNAASFILLLVRRSNTATLPEQCIASSLDNDPVVRDSSATASQRRFS